VFLSEFPQPCGGLHSLVQLAVPHLRDFFGGGVRPASFSEPDRPTDFIWPQFRGSSEKDCCWPIPEMAAIVLAVPPITKIASSTDSFECRILFNSQVS